MVESVHSHDYLHRRQLCKNSDDIRNVEIYMDEVVRTCEYHETIYESETSSNRGDSGKRSFFPIFIPKNAISYPLRWISSACDLIHSRTLNYNVNTSFRCDWTGHDGHLRFSVESEESRRKLYNNSKERIMYRFIRKLIVETIDKSEAPTTKQNLRLILSLTMLEEIELNSCHSTADRVISITNGLKQLKRLRCHMTHDEYNSLLNRPDFDHNFKFRTTNDGPKFVAIELIRDNIRNNLSSMLTVYLYACFPEN